MRYLFITGLYRSGSTLLDKILHNHPQMQVGSQPFPFLYFKAKEKFLAERQIQQRYPFEHMFRQKNYTPAAFTEFLKSHVFSAEEISRLLQDMTTYSGQTMPDFLQFCQQETSPSGTFAEVYQQLMALLMKFFKAEKSACTGTKEILCEEYIPFFLDRKMPVLLIVRDPRDIVTSMNYGRGEAYGGKPRPTLYIIRQWRKNISFILEFQQNPLFKFVKYESLVKNPRPVMDELTAFLDISPFPDDFFSRPILDQQGTPWSGNSSFDRFSSVSTRSISRFKETLPENVIRYIEATCYPELHVLGYDLMSPVDRTAITGFTEEKTVTHEKFSADYSSRQEHITDELQRLDYLTKTTVPDKKQQELWYIFPRTYQVLRETLSNQK